MIKYLESKNPYWEKLNTLDPSRLKFARSNQDTEAHPGQWRKQFANPGQDDCLLHVELGCNAGHVVLEWAKARPNERFIGMDWKFKQIYRLLEKVEKNKIQNLMAFRANQERLSLVFAPKEIDFLYLFFPDPWPKKAHRKNRIFSAHWLNSIRPLLSGRGFFHIKTDHREYFDQMNEIVESLPDWEILDRSYDLHAGNPESKKLQIPEVTLFEKLFIKDNLPIHSLRIRPKSR